jgi:hypothetical protein
MKALITLLLIAGVYFFGKAIFDQYKAKEQKEEAAAKAATGPADGIEGMPAKFQPSLDEAQAQGAPALKAWLERYASYIQDPKLAAIQLDYVVLVSRSDPAEGKRVFQAVRARVPKGSPVYERVKRLESTYGN